MTSCLAIKESIDRSFELGLTEGTLFERRVFNALFSTDDKKEGMSAFIEKRKPKFKDK
jgi:enoyl-CoA hydratase